MSHPVLSSTSFNHRESRQQSPKVRSASYQPWSWAMAWASFCKSARFICVLNHFNNRLALVSSGFFRPQSKQMADPFFP